LAGGFGAFGAGVAFGCFLLEEEGGERRPKAMMAS
jgi:hypothetical protein